MRQLVIFFVVSLWILFLPLNTIPQENKIQRENNIDDFLNGLQNFEESMNEFISQRHDTIILEAMNDTVYVTAGVPILVNVLKNDRNPSGEPLLASVLQHNHGLAYGVSDSNIYYQAFLNFFGVDTVKYEIRSQSSPQYYSQANIIVHVKDCDAFKVLDVNEVKAGFMSFGLWHANSNSIGEPLSAGEYFPLYEVPANSDIHSIFCSRFWIMGLDDDERICGIGGRYGGIGLDLHPGPIADMLEQEDILKWRKIWKITRSEIEYHKANWWKPDYIPVEDIISWPGNGDTSNGESQILAPFVDVDNDGFYEPMQGEYPVIRGDQMLFNILNDKRYHTATQSDTMELEIHVTAYAFDFPNDSLFNYSTFIHLDLYNRSHKTYHDCYVGVFSDLDLGYPYDDYIGSNVEQGYYFIYNSRIEDGNGEPGTYGLNPPVQSIAILGGPYLDPDGKDNPRYDEMGNQLCNESINGLNFGDSIADNERYGMTYFLGFSNTNNYGDPIIASDYYNYMQGLWKDSTTMYYGGSGYPTSGTVGPKCRFMFPGDSDSCNWGTGGITPNGGFNQNGYYWTEETLANEAGDRRGAASSGPFTFYPGQKQQLDLAFLWARDPNGGGTEKNLKIMEDMVLRLRGLFVQDSVPNGSSFFDVPDQNDKNLTCIICPNPAQERVNIEFPYRINNGMVNIYSFNGLLVMSKAISGAKNVSLNLSSLRGGIYFCAVYDGKGICSGKIVVMDF